jgi:thymidylate kinase
MIINTTGRDSDQLLALNNALRGAGYSTFMLFVDVDREVALQRIANREKHATDPRDIGRKVEPDYFEQAYAQSKKNASFYAMTFGNNFAVAATDDEKSMTLAGKKIQKFIGAPLTPKAEGIIQSLRSSTR